MTDSDADEETVDNELVPPPPLLPPKATTAISNPNPTIAKLDGMHARVEAVLKNSAAGTSRVDVHNLVGALHTIIPDDDVLVCDATLATTVLTQTSSVPTMWVCADFVELLTIIQPMQLHIATEIRREEAGIELKGLRPPDPQ